MNNKERAKPTLYWIRPFILTKKSNGLWSFSPEKCCLKFWKVSLIKLETVVASSGILLLQKLER